MVAVAGRLVGSQVPSVELAPAFARSLAGEALELGERCGLVADPWQRRVLEPMLGLNEDGSFAAFKVGLNVPRQNGKGVLLELRELAGVFLLGERFITHSSQQMDTSLDAMRRLLDDLEEGGLDDQIKAARTANGQEAIIFKSKQRIRFRTRSKTGGRGLSGECVILDEAMFLAEYVHSALVPMLTAQPRPQLIYAGSAVDQQVHEHGLVFSRLREEAAAGRNGRLAYFEWSAGLGSPAEVPEELDMRLVAKANPSLGIRITEAYIEDEWTTLDQRGRAVERLGVGDWPRTDQPAQTVIDMVLWGGLADAGSELVGPVFFGFDVSPERSAAVAAAGRRADGLWHVEVIQARRGTSWLAGYLAAKVEQHEPAGVVCDAMGPVGSVLQAVAEAGVSVRTVNSGEHAAACGKFVDVVADRELRHLEQPSLSGAVRGAATRPLGDAWLWSRKSSGVDISPLVAATLALDAAMSSAGDGDFTVY